MALAIDKGVGALLFALLGGVVPGSTKGTDQTFESHCIPLSRAGLAVVAGVEVRFFGRTGTLTCFLVKGEVFRTSNAFLVGQIPSSRFRAGDAFACSVGVVLTLAFALFGGWVPSAVGLAGFALVGGCVPFSVAGLADVVGIKVRLVLWTGALRGVLVKAEPFRTPHAFFVLEVPRGRSRTGSALAGTVIEKLTLALALLGEGVEGLVILASDALVSTVGVWLVSGTYAVEQRCVPDFAVCAVGREG